LCFAAFLCILHANVNIKSVENCERRNFPFPAIGKSDQQWSKILSISNSEEVCKDIVFSCEALKRLCKHASVHQRCKKLAISVKVTLFGLTFFLVVRPNYDITMRSVWRLTKLQVQKYLYFTRKCTKPASYDAFIHSRMLMLVKLRPKLPVKPNLDFWVLSG